MQYDGLNAWKQKPLPDPDKQKALSFSTKLSGSNNGTKVNSIQYMDEYHRINPVARDEWRTNPNIYTSKAHPRLTRHGFSRIDPYTQKPYEKHIPQSPFDKPFTSAKRGGGKNKSKTNKSKTNKSKTKSNRRKLIGGKNARIEQPPIQVSQRQEIPQNFEEIFAQARQIIVDDGRDARTDQQRNNIISRVQSLIPQRGFGAAGFVLMASGILQEYGNQEFAELLMQSYGLRPRQGGKNATKRKRKIKLTKKKKGKTMKKRKN